MSHVHDTRIDKIFSPESVAIVGAMRTKGTVPHDLFHNILDGGYRKVPREAHPEDNWVWSPQDAIDMHRPEKWGYVEFATEAREPRRDETWPARELLMDLYYQRKRGSAEFVFRGVRDPSLSDVRIEQAPWRASVECAGRRVEVDESGRLTISR